MRTVPIVTVVLTALLCAACREDPPAAPVRPVPPPSLAVQADTAYPDSAVYPEESETRAIASRFPGYAGISFDAARGVLVVSMTDSGQSLGMLAPARQSAHDQPLSDRLGLRGNTAPIEPRIVPYSYRQLQRWRRILSSRLRASRTNHFVMLDVIANQLLVGTPNPGMVSQIAAPGNAEIIPAGAIRVSTDMPRAAVSTTPLESPPFPAKRRTTSTMAANDSLTSRNRPIEGGMYISVLKTKYVTAPTLGACTVGLGVTYNGVPGFLTGTHCSDEAGRVGPTITAFAQPKIQQIETDLAGRESVDPPFTSAICEYQSAYQNMITTPVPTAPEPPLGPIPWDGPWPSNPNPPTVVLCRQSDALFATWDPLVTAVNGTSLGTIARPIDVADPAHNNKLTGPLEINQSNRRFYVTAELSGYPMPGIELDKVGARTGWSRGLVIGGQTEAYTVQSAIWTHGPDPDTVWSIRKQTMVTFPANNGDSGSPVFLSPATGATSVTLVGFLTGALGTLGYITSMHQLRAEMTGALNVLAANPPPPPPPPPLVASILGPSSVKANNSCMWAVSASGGTGIFSYQWKKNGVNLPSNSADVTLASSSAFTLSVTVTDNAGGSATASKSVSISSSAPTCQF